MNKEKIVMTSIKELLAGGATAEELLKDYEKQLEAAKKELEAEKRAASEKEAQLQEIEDARENLMEAFEWYYDSIGVDWSEKEEEQMVKALKTLEQFKLKGGSFTCSTSFSTGAPIKKECKCEKAAEPKPAKTVKDYDKIVADFFRKYGL